MLLALPPLHPLAAEAVTQDFAPRYGSEKVALVPEAQPVYGGAGSPPPFLFCLRVGK